MFQNVFSFDGRIRRLEYGLTTIILSFAGQLFQALLLTLESKAARSFLMIFYLFMIYVSFAQGTKRCHDLGKSGWWMLVPFYSLWMYFADGEYGHNEYGPNPKGLGNDDFDEIDSIGEEIETTQRL